MRLAGVALGVGAVLVALPMAVATLALGGVPRSAGEPSAGGGFGVSTFARSDIPPSYLALYLRAASRYGLDWSILAGIGKVECDHGRDPAPSCTREGAVNSAGAGGPAQFLASTWRQYGVDGDGDGVIDRWDPADAIFGMANYLRASGAPADYGRAIYAYNHAGWYVAEVEHWASRYRGPVEGAAGVGEAGGGGAGAGETGETRGALSEGGASTGSPTPMIFIPGEHARLSPTDGHLALVPSEAPATVQALVVAGNELQDLPYGSAGHPDPRGALNEDCSSTVNYVLYRAGVRPIAEILQRNPLAQDYVDWGLPGPGRWVTIYATRTPTAHVFVVIAGLRLDTSHHGTDLGPNRDQDGPRWRILDHIPTWAHWSVRHPPGL